MNTAEEYFQLALEKDSNCTLAYAGLANVMFIRPDIGLVPPSAAYPAAISAVTKALLLYDGLAEVHVILGNCRFANEWDWSAVEMKFRKAIKLNPNYGDEHFFCSDFLMSMGRLDEASAEMDRALKMDPFNFFYQSFFGWHLVYRHQYDDALAQLHKTI